ncbi:alpha/beta hydrolase family esterase [Pseudooctadecabacter jejudonensis]|uniref:Alpha/beta hydrolase family protein n=1 Tax=Pseudooctadecabacter jejudonensis TaxID=1391910 RepID=A0A1Y5RR82_9RHOB|nr:polyhydroxybutyrate depolymerase [Pseudooctadecabacter jejudonensis]SLN20623.1 hypothetical protein PSJ8397_00774 [Pseudooctadecabacter jejudonensis]
MRQLLVCLWMGLQAPVAQACTGQDACELGERSYHLRVPDSWDGASPLPVLLHFHGWGRAGGLIVRHDRIATGKVAEDVLLVAPTGLGGSWDFRRVGSRDSAFARAVLEDVAARYPVLADAIFVSGYSYGAYMAWRFVCDDGADIAGLLAVAGSFADTAPCEAAPREVRQVYGLSDQVLDFPYGPAGETDTPVALWRDRFDCNEANENPTPTEWNARSFLTFERQIWTCAGGRIVLDLHPGGHFIPHDWIPIQVDEILQDQRP